MFRKCLYSIMDDVIKFVVLMLIVVLSGLHHYCTKYVCSSEIKKYYMYTLISSVYVINLYYFINNYRQYTNHTWIIATLLFIGPIIIYMIMCQQKCNELFLPTFSIVFPCMMIIFNLSVWVFQ
jgi:hypothetical protein